MKPRLYISLLMMGTALKAFPQISLTDKYANSFPLADGKTCAAICYDKEDALVVERSAWMLADDIEDVTGRRPYQPLPW